MPLVLLILLPFLGSLVAAVLPANARNTESTLAGLIAVACTVQVAMCFPEIAAGEVLRQDIAWLPSLGLNLVIRMDGFAWMFCMLVLGIGSLVVLYARYYMSAADPVPRFFSFLLAFMGAMTGVVLSGNIIQLAFFWELTSLFSFLLIGYWHHRQDARRGARMALTVTGTGGLCMLAAAMAGDSAEARRLAQVEARAADLETRAVAALAAGCEDLAREAAEAITSLEAERDALRAARATFAAEVVRMRTVLADATRRQAALERGRRVAAASEAVRRLRRTEGVRDRATLREAEATLARLQRIQAEATDTDDALAAIETPEETLAERLEREGFGPRTRPSSDDVRARLRSRAEAARAASA